MRKPQETDRKEKKNIQRGQKKRKEKRLRERRNWFPKICLNIIFSYLQEKPELMAADSVQL